jgi:hypothetical protein
MRLSDDQPDGVATPETLYFFEYPPGQSPTHLIPGYWALDEDGTDASTITSCFFEEDKWNICMELKGLRFDADRSVLGILFSLNKNSHNMPDSARLTSCDFLLPRPSCFRGIRRGSRSAPSLFA